MADDKHMTVEEALRRVQALKKDVDYVGNLESKWRDQQRRFPIIYEGIQKQAEAFKKRIEQLKTIKVETTIEELDRLRQAVASGKPLQGLFEDSSEKTTPSGGGSDKA
jgi:hypothetical protein